MQNYIIAASAFDLVSAGVYSERKVDEVIVTVASPGDAMAEGRAVLANDPSLTTFTVMSAD